MQIIGEHCLFDPLGKRGGIVTGIGADPVANAGGDIPGTCGGIALVLGLLINFQTLDDALQGGVYLVHLVKGNAGDLKTLAAGDVDGTVAVFFCNVLQHAQILCFQMAARNTDTGCSESPLFGHTEGIFLQFSGIGSW